MNDTSMPTARGGRRTPRAPTVVTIWDRSTTITTGFLGMNLLAEAVTPMAARCCGSRRVRVDDGSHR
jgi:hypothetical protein